VVLTATYGPRAQDMWRWVDEEADKPISEFVARFAGLEPAEREATRVSLTREDHGRLLVYAHRSAFAAVRREDPALARSALIAMSLVSATALIDDRVIWTIAGIVCYAYRRVNGIDRGGIDALLSDADSTVRETFADILDGGGPGLVFDSGVREVTTRAGRVFLHDEERPYAPQADLIEMAYTVAELLEIDRYHVESIAIADALRLYAFGDTGDHVDLVAVEAARRQIAAVHVEAVLDDGPYQPLRVYIVELADDHDAALVAAAADRRDWPNEIQIAVAAGSICAVLRIDFRDDDEPFIETVDALERFRSMLLAAIRAPAA
jgi:hypothetical protein